ncbi:Slx4p interacting protein [Ascosphaera pollenicola]|nr:Slx4p interacting protein [Ascosphaera pollenicola]
MENISCDSTLDEFRSYIVEMEALRANYRHTSLARETTFLSNLCPGYDPELHQYRTHCWTGSIASTSLYDAAISAVLQHPGFDPKTYAAALAEYLKIQKEELPSSAELRAKCQKLLDALEMNIEAAEFEVPRTESDKLPRLMVRGLEASDRMPYPYKNVKCCYCGEKAVCYMKGPDAEDGNECRPYYQCDNIGNCPRKELTNTNFIVFADHRGNLPWNADCFCNKSCKLMLFYKRPLFDISVLQGEEIEFKDDGKPHVVGVCRMGNCQYYETVRHANGKPVSLSEEEVELYIQHRVV